MVFKFTFKIQLISPNGSHLFGKDHIAIYGNANMRRKCKDRFREIRGHVITCSTLLKQVLAGSLKYQTLDQYFFSTCCILFHCKILFVYDGN